jgi:acyl-CoA hydrolase
MFSIHFLTSPDKDHGIEMMTCAISHLDEAVRMAKSVCVDVQQKHPDVIGFRIVDNSRADKPEVKRWFASDDVRA